MTGVFQSAYLATLVTLDFQSHMLVNLSLANRHFPAWFEQRASSSTQQKAFNNEKENTAETYTNVCPSNPLLNFNVSKHKIIDISYFLLYREHLRVLLYKSTLMLHFD
ncbi:hypothetical protein RF11_01560 [Thelohanellus kitauei]|uniref:Uncharacterized protein n=1 Tax=Thelohanellus kitauei TaxID=669202 RepID=A0A0C2M741_THEKT|nr:hypothetical protein RF11_01560 [Thelohanellus kitauei]